ncbi:MAG: SRPBCC family protein [Myxococcota bacterium]
MSRARILKRALLANASFSTATGLASLIAAPKVAALLGNPELEAWIFGLGPALLGFAAVVAWVATRKTISPRLAFAISLADFCWVIGSLVLWLVAPTLLATTGWIAVAIVAAFVLVFAETQLFGLALLFRNDGSRGSYRSMLTFERRIDAAAEKVWPLMSDLEGYHEVAPNIAFSRIVSGEGPDAVRACGDHEGGEWTERITEWVEGRRYAMVVATDAKDYPYPFRGLRGEWEVEPRPDGSVMRLRFDFTMPGGVFGEVLTATALAPKFTPIVESILDRWETMAKR